MARGFRRKGSRCRTPGTPRSSTRSSAPPSRGSWTRCTTCSTRPRRRREGGDDFASIVAGLGMGVTVAAEDQADLDPDDAERDPALDRLLPTANRQDDEVAAEFRRLTETGLRQRKAAALETAADLLRGEDKLRLDDGAGPRVAHRAHRRAPRARGADGAAHRRRRRRARGGRRRTSTPTTRWPTRWPSTTSSPGCRRPWRRRCSRGERPALDGRSGAARRPRLQCTAHDVTQMTPCRRGTGARWPYLKTVADSPIGVFDSGYGGLTVMRAVLDQLPHESVAYFGDTARAPYGPRPIAQTRELALECLDRLVDHGVKILVIACNTASAAVLHDARERYDVPGGRGDPARGAPRGRGHPQRSRRRHLHRSAPTSRAPTSTPSPPHRTSTS